LFCEALAKRDRSSIKFYNELLKDWIPAYVRMTKEMEKLKKILVCKKKSDVEGGSSINICL